MAYLILFSLSLSLSLDIDHLESYKPIDLAGIILYWRDDEDVEQTPIHGPS